MISVLKNKIRRDTAKKKFRLSPGNCTSGH